MPLILEVRWYASKRMNIWNALCSKCPQWPGINNLLLTRIVFRNCGIIQWIIIGTKIRSLRWSFTDVAGEGRLCQLGLGWPGQLCSGDVCYIEEDTYSGRHPGNKNTPHIYHTHWKMFHFTIIQDKIIWIFFRIFITVMCACQDANEAWTTIHIGYPSETHLKILQAPLVKSPKPARPHPAGALCNSL